MCTDSTGMQHTATVNDTFNHADVSGDTVHVILNANGNGGGSAELNHECGFPNSNVTLTGGIQFVITSPSENVSISVGGSVSGNPDRNSIVFSLRGPNGTLGTVIIGPNGTITSGSIAGGVLPMGSYTVTVGVDANSLGTPGVSAAQNFGYSLSVNVTIGAAPADIHWNALAGGDFNDPLNWNPQKVPTSIDHAFFDLPNLASSILVQATNVHVGNLSILGMQVDLRGVVQVLNSGIGFEVAQKGGIPGLLQLDSGSTLMTNDGIIGTGSGNTSPSTAVIVTDKGTSWTVGTSNPLQIGFLEPAVVLVDQGGLLNAQKAVDIGALDVQGQLEVHNNALVTTPFLGVGSTGSHPSTMLVDSGGATQVSDTISLGDYSSSLTDANAVVTIAGERSDGTGQSSLMAADTVSVAGGSGTQIEVKDGGLLDVSNGSLSVGHNLELGTLHVHGASAHFAAAAFAVFTFVGSKVAPSQLIVEDGGAFNSLTLVIGSVSGDIGMATVSNTRAFSARALAVGFDGQGTLNISSSGKVASDSGLVPAADQPNQTAFGKVFITGPQLPTSPDSEWDVTGDCVVGSKATGLVSLNGTRVGFTNIVFGATLNVGGTLTIDAFGAVIGNGKLVAGNRVINGGIISPGLSPGVIEIDGDYEQTPDGLLKMEAAGLNPGDFDVLHITGSATLDGTMQVTFLNGYLPKTGDVLPFLQINGAVNADFATITFPQLAPGFQFSTEIVNGQFQLTALNDAVLATSLSKLTKFSAEGPVQGKTVLASTFKIVGSDAIKVIVRGLGPSLDVPGPVADPALRLVDHTGAVIARNDNWKSSQQTDIEATGFAPTNDLESAIVIILQPGTYTATLIGKGNGGIGLLDVHDLNPELNSEFMSLNTFGEVRGGDSLIGNFTIGNGLLKEKVLLRALGLGLKDTILELANTDGSTILINDNWQDLQKADIEATGLEPANKNDSAILATLDPGSYVVMVRGKNDNGGTVLLQVYKLP